MSAQPSPAQSPKLTMDFFDALRQVNDGKAITKLAWNDREIRVVMAEGKVGNVFCKGICIRQHGGRDIGGEEIFSTRPFFVSDGDLIGSDWIVVD